MANFWASSKWKNNSSTVVIAHYLTQLCQATTWLFQNKCFSQTFSLSYWEPSKDIYIYVIVQFRRRLSLNVHILENPGLHNERASSHEKVWPCMLIVWALFILDSQRKPMQGGPDRDCARGGEGVNSGIFPCGNQTVRSQMDNEPGCVYSSAPPIRLCMHGRTHAGCMRSIWNWCGKKVGRWQSAAVAALCSSSAVCWKGLPSKTLEHGCWVKGAFLSTWGGFLKISL